METKRKWTKTEDYEAIVLKNLYGMSYEKIAEELKVSVETVRRVVKAQEIVKDQNWEEAGEVGEELVPPEQGSGRPAYKIQ